jgi:hypothetical protein
MAATEGTVMKFVIGAAVAIGAAIGSVVGSARIDERLSHIESDVRLVKCTLGFTTPDCPPVLPGQARK